MSISNLILLAMLALGTAAPFITLYAASLAKKRKYNGHKRTHTILFAAMAALVVLFEANIIFSDDGSFLPEGNPYLETAFFNSLLTAHIIGAVITFLIWGSILFISSAKFGRKLPGTFSGLHKVFG